MIADDYIPLNTSSVHLGKAVALRSKEDVEAKALPTRIKIFEWGENIGRTSGARIVVGEKTLATLSANQNAQARDTVALDYEHQTFPGHPAYKEPPHHVAAHGSLEVVKGEGVYHHSLSYTPNGEEYAPNYPDVSPVAYTDDQDNLIFIHSVALTQAGDVKGLDFTAALSATIQQKPTMDPDKKDKYREMLVKLLKLQPSAGEEQVSDEAIVAAIEAAETAKPAPDDGEGKALSASESKALSDRLDKMERDAIVDRSIAAGKVIPLSAEQIAETPVATLSAMVEKLPAGQVPTESKTQTEKPKDEPVALSASDKQLCKNLGLTEEEYKASL